jgi:hypothetical protein
VPCHCAPCYVPGEELTTTTLLPSSFPVMNDYTEQIIPITTATIALLIVALLIGAIVAKLTEYCLERAIISDNASDMSDYTRELLKAQLVLAFNKGKKGKKDKPEDIARKYGKLWYGKMKRNKARRIKANKANKELEKDKTSNANSNSKSGAFLKVPVHGKKAPVATLAVVDETKKENKGATVTPPTANVPAQKADSKRATQHNSVAPITPTADTNNTPANTNPHRTNEHHSAAPPPPTKKPSVAKTNVASRPISAGLKKAGPARPVSAKPPPVKHT